MPNATKKTARNAERALRDWHARTGRVLVCGYEAIDAFDFAGVSVADLYNDGVLDITDDVRRDVLLLRERHKAMAPE